MSATPQTNPDAATAPVPLGTVLRQFPRTVWLIYIGSFINRFGTFVLPFLGLHMTREGYTAGEIGLAMGSYGLGHVIATILGGFLADRVGRKETIVFSMYSGAVAMLALSQASSLPGFILLAGLAGLTSELYRPGSTALLSDLVPESQRVMAFGVYRFFINAGWAIGPATAGFLSEYSYQWLFYGDAATTVIYGTIALFGLSRGQGPQSETEPESPLVSLLAGFRVALGDPRFVRMIVSNVLIAWVFMQLMTTLSMEMKWHGHPERVYGLVLGLNGVIIVIFEVPLTAWVRRWNPIAALGWGYGFFTVGAAMIAFVDSREGYAVAMAICTIGEMLSMPVGLAYVSSLAPHHMRGRYMGVYGLTWASAIMLGPSLGMVLIHRDPEWFWLGCGFVGVLATALILSPTRFWQLRPGAVVPPQCVERSRSC